MGQCCSARRRASRTRLEAYCADLRQGAAADASAVSMMFFPMFVVRVADFLVMESAQPHQVLHAAGLAVEYVPSLGAAAFVSHQWCSRSHPDPCFQQLSVLQAALRNALARTLALQVDLISFFAYRLKASIKEQELSLLAEGCIWYDYFSVPQPDVPHVGSRQHMDITQDLGKAVMSIPAYVAMCEYFLILAPPIPHVNDPARMVDFHSWKSRGWCRLERAARVLSPRRTDMLLVPNSQRLVQVGAQEYLVDPVLEGAFGVDSDRERLAPILVALLSNKLQALLRAQDLHRYRRLLSFRPALLRGLPEKDWQGCSAPRFRRQEHGGAVERFLDLYGFRSVSDLSSRGVPPILFAATSCDAELLRALLAQRADLASREPHLEPEFLVTKGSSVLFRAALCAKETSALHVLLEHRADLEAAEAEGSRPISQAVFGGHMQAVSTLLAAGADGRYRSTWGTDIMTVAAVFGRHEIVRQLIAAGFETAPSADGGSPLWHASMFVANVETVLALLQAPDCSLDTPLAPGKLSVRLPFIIASIPHRLWGSKKQLALLGYHALGTTPLMAAALAGNVAEARALVAAGADTTARNARGKTAAELAELVGVSPANVAFFRKPHPILHVRAWELVVDLDSWQEPDCS